MVGGELVVGLDDAQLTRLATADDVAKLSVRDLAVAAAPGADGATTVAATSAVAAAAGIARLRHRRARRRAPRGAPTFDESADLVTLARTPIAVVCAGREVDPGRRRHAGTAGDAGGRRGRLPHPPLPRLLPHRRRLRPGLVSWTPRSRSPPSLRARAAQGVHAGALVRGQPAAGRRAARPGPARPGARRGPGGLERDGITGKAVTPFLLAHFHERDRRARASRSTSGSSCATPTWPRRSPSPRHDRAPPSPPPTARMSVWSSATWSPTCWPCTRTAGGRLGHRRPRSRVTGGGQAANTAAWLAARGRTR